MNTIQLNNSKAMHLFNSMPGAKIFKSHDELEFIYRKLCYGRQRKEILKEAVLKLDNLQKTLDIMLLSPLIQIQQNEDPQTIDVQINSILKQLKVNYREEEENFINNMLKNSEAITYIQEQTVKTAGTCKDVNGKVSKRVESYKISRINEKLKKTRKRLREQFIIGKVKKTKVLLKDISDTISYCEQKIMNSNLNQEVKDHQLKEKFNYRKWNSTRLDEENLDDPTRKEYELRAKLFFSFVLRRTLRFENKY